MKIAINTIPLLSPLTGIGNYTWKISRAMAQLVPDHDYTYYYGFYSQRLFCTGQNDGTLSRAQNAFKNMPGLGRSLRLLKGAAASLSLSRFDVYFEPNFIPVGIKARKTVVTVADFSPFLYPQWHRKEQVEYFQKNFTRRIGRADQIIVISDFIRTEAIDEFGFAADKVTTAHLGYDQNVFFPRERADLAALRTRLNLPRRFLLFVGSIEPRKNLMRLLKAYQLLPKSLRSNIKLVLAGFHGWDNAEVMTLLNKLEGDVMYLGYVTERDLAGLFNLADLFVYPTLYEGFGLPPLEAMACGCPVLVSQVASLPEVCGDAADYFNPEQIDDICAALVRILKNEDRLNHLSSLGRERAAGFSWEKSAIMHLEIFSKD